MVGARLDLVGEVFTNLALHFCIECAVLWLEQPDILGQRALFYVALVSLGGLEAPD